MDTKTLTYAELGEALGITAASAKRLSNRRKWAKVKGNDGLARVIVPADRLATPRPVTEDDPRDAPEDSPGDDPRDAPGDVPGGVPGGDPRGIPGDARALIAHLEARIGELADEMREARTTIAELTAKAGRGDVLEALLGAERERGRELRQERDRLLTVVTERSREGLFTRLRRAFG